MKEAYMNKIITHIDLDLSSSNKYIIINAQQFDNDTRRLEIQLFHNGTLYDISSVSKIKIEGHRGDGLSIWKDGLKQGSCILFDLEDDVLGAKGICELKVSLYEENTSGNDKLLSSFPFCIKVDENVFDENGVIASPQYSELQNEMRKIKNLEKNIETNEQIRQSGYENMKNTVNGIKDSIGEKNGIAELDENGFVISSQLPSYVDDIVEGYFYNYKFYHDPDHRSEIIGEAGKIYVDISGSNKIYRWSGSSFVIISDTIALGETSSTAFRGDRGKMAYNHSQTAHAPSNAEINQNAFSKIVVGSTTITANEKTDKFTLIAGSNITLTPNITNRNITISAGSVGTTRIKTFSNVSINEYQLANNVGLGSGYFWPCYYSQLKDLSAFSDVENYSDVPINFYVTLSIPGAVYIGTAHYILWDKKFYLLGQDAPCPSSSMRPFKSCTASYNTFIGFQVSEENKKPFSLTICAMY